MQIELGLLDIDKVKEAVDAEIDDPPRLLPASSLSPALTGERDAVADWVFGLLHGNFVPTREEVVLVSKPAHGVRPVAFWDLPSKIAYAASAAALDLQEYAIAKRPAWKAFQRAPLTKPGDYIVASDISACYQYVDHQLLGDELLTQGGNFGAIETIQQLLRETSGRTYGLPQQSAVSDKLAEVFLGRLERALVRRGLETWRYNDDFRFVCSSWAETTRAVEVFAEECRLLGFTPNDLKTVTWRRANYAKALNEADALRDQIAQEAEFELAEAETDPYDNIEYAVPLEATEVDALGARRVLERWSDLIGTDGKAADRRVSEYRALLQLMPAALRTLENRRETDSGVLDLCFKILRFEQTMTPAVGALLISRQDDDDAILSAFDKFISENAYLNGWQIWWLQQPLTRLSDLMSGPSASTREDWFKRSFEAVTTSPVLRAHIALTLARHKKISAQQIVDIFDRSPASVQPVLSGALATLKPGPELREAVRGHSPVCRWTYDWYEKFA